MKKEYDFASMKAVKNPYAAALKKQITGIPYQTLIDSYLTDCAQCKRKLTMHWK